ncbi:MAG: hypothetical protein HC838_01870 [Spirulinaceae cyanobacterium RM2_2_10]|nr:hypothetical protein [Spirulinaceae cyanobacterium RM2_2_10]
MINQNPSYGQGWWGIDATFPTAAPTVTHHHHRTDHPIAPTLTGGASLRIQSWQGFVTDDCHRLAIALGGGR